MKLVTYDKLYIETLIRKRPDEVKLGECVGALPWNAAENLLAALKENKCRYVILGLPEDIGVRANGGRGGAYSAWQPAINTLLNTQSNRFFHGDELLVLGHVDFSDEMNLVKNFDFRNHDDVEKARSLVKEIDDYVTEVISAIIEAGKEAIVIGGGHNNAYPCMKGSQRGLKAAGKISGSTIHAINCDAHSDCRPLEGRHSGNAFSYAFHDGFLSKYAVVGLHESYNSGHVIGKLDAGKHIHYTTYEDIYIRENTTFNQAVESAINFVSGNYTGLEIDLDSVQNIPSSAKTSSGVSPVEARRYIHKVASSLNVAYLHIAEAAPVLSHIKTDLKTGKLISYLVSDYIKARNQFHQVQAYETTH